MSLGLSFGEEKYIREMSSELFQKAMSSKKQSFETRS